MVVLSLFDGMGCGLLALKKASIEVSAYFGSEIDKYAMQIANKNHPEIIHIGNVTKVRYTNGVLHTENGDYPLPRVDIVIGGSPCQGFSIAGKQLNFDDPRSKLFFEFHRIVQECKQANSNLLFLLENVRMKAEHEAVITQYMGVNPVLINSSLLSAQNRERLYWTNINQVARGLFGDLYTDIPQPADKGILLKHILQPETEIADKYYLSAKALARIERKLYSDPKFFDADNPDNPDNPVKTGTINTKNNGGQLSIDGGTTLVQKGVVPPSIDSCPPLRSRIGAAHDNKIAYTNKEAAQITQAAIEGMEKANCLTPDAYLTHGKRDRDENGKAILTSMHLRRIRRLTEIECERLQTVPDNYTEGVSSTQRYKMLGNGWTADVVAYIFSFIKNNNSK